MIKKRALKKIIIYVLTIIVFCNIVFFLILLHQKNVYKTTVNNAIGGIIDEIVAKYPNVSEEELVRLLNNKNNKEVSDVLKKFGYMCDDFYLANFEKQINNTIKENLIVMSVFIIFFIIIVLIYYKKQCKKIDEINNYFIQLNNKNYELKIADNGEDELSKLKNQLYKTTIFLKEQAENSELERKNLSNALEDISHQLKTPITSIRILLDNIQENPNMDEETKKEFINEISNQVNWISTLVVSLLKLAKFDAGIIVMNDKLCFVQDIINKVLENLAILIEIKNITIDQYIDEAIQIKCDFNWQVEAFTNIIKNAIEHSKEGAKITIKVESNSLFVRATIQDSGEGISKKDIKHIFERFYKSENSSNNSIGIGLALSKKIFDNENAYISVESEEGIGTKFDIKYMKKL